MTLLRHHKRMLTGLNAVLVVAVACCALYALGPVDSATSDKSETARKTPPPSKKNLKSQNRLKTIRVFTQDHFVNL